MDGFYRKGTNLSFEATGCDGSSPIGAQVSSGNVLSSPRKLKLIHGQDTHIGSRLSRILC
jgi:hypothetical protein